LGTGITTTQRGSLWAQTEEWYEDSLLPEDVLREGRDVSSEGEKPFNLRGDKEGRVELTWSQLGT